MNLNYVMFEDEYLTSLYLQKTISDLRPDYKLVAHADNVMEMERIIHDSNPDFIICGGHLADGISTKEMARIGVDNSIVLFSEDSDLLSKTNDLKVVYSALKPITRNNVQEAILKMEEIIESGQSDSANSLLKCSSSISRKSYLQEKSFSS